MKYAVRFAWLLWLMPILVSGQYMPVMDGNPTSVDWRIIRTPSFRIIFPAGYEAQGNRMANTLEHIRLPESHSIGRPSFSRMPVIMQNRSAISNGFVTLAPLRSEFFAMPTQNYNFLGSNDWLNLLASHEYRHMAQFRQSARGFNKLLLVMFGQQALAGMSYLSVPPWFWEGDAVVTETAFTHSGRGRIPNFDMAFRTNLQEGRVFDYDKQFLRSYKHFIPNHYVLGYHMVSYLRERTGDPDAWEKVTRRTWSVPFLPGRFSGSIRKVSGVSVGRLYKEMATERIKSWTEEAANIPLSRFEVISQRTGTAYTDYEHPQYLQDGSLVALKSGIGHIQQLVIFRDGREHKLSVAGQVNESGMLSAAGNQVVWNEFRFDPRWPARTWSVVKIHDFDSGRFHSRTLTHKTRYAGAALSPDQRKVVTVETGEDYKNRIVLLDSRSGNIINVLSDLEGSFYSMVRWNERGDFITALRQDEGRKSVVQINPQTGEERQLIVPGYEHIGNPFWWGDYLFYNAAVGGVDNILVKRLSDGTVFRVTESRYGAYDITVSPDGKWLAYANQSANGLDVVRIPFEPESWKEYVPVQTDDMTSRAEFLASQEGRPQLFDTIPNPLWRVQRYNKVLHMLKPHSWGAYVNSDLTRASLGLSSRDLLGTLSVYGGYEADIQERTGSWKFQASLQAMYPIVDLEYSRSNRSVKVADDLEFIQSVNGQDTVKVRGPLSFSWQEENKEAGLRIPLNLTASRFFTQLNLSGALGNTVVSDFQNSFDQGGRLISKQYPQYFFRSYQDNGRLFYGRFGISAYHLMRRSIRDINSKWGQALFINANQSVPGSDFSGTQVSITDYMYFPGLFRHHSLWGYWAYQDTRINWRDRIDYTFRNQVPLPRGASVSRAEKMYSMSANYTFPLWYPDVHIGPLLNIKRLRVNGFTDYAFSQNPALSEITRRSEATAYLSAGGELRVDLNFLRFLPEFDLGVRVVQVLRPQQSFQVELLLGTFNF